jgi:cell division protein FtsB
VSADEKAVDIGIWGWLTRLVRWCIFFAIIGWIVANYLPLIQTNRELRRALDSDETRLRALEQQQRGQRQRIESLKHDPRAIERAARERLQLARPDETVVTFVPGPTSVPARTNSLPR